MLRLSSPKKRQRVTRLAQSVRKGVSRRSSPARKQLRLVKSAVSSAKSAGQSVPSAVIVRNPIISFLPLRAQPPRSHPSLEISISTRITNNHTIDINIFRVCRQADPFLLVR